jgi:hypothetical protein
MNIMENEDVVVEAKESNKRTAPGEILGSKRISIELGSS